MKVIQYSGLFFVSCLLGYLGMVIFMSIQYHVLPMWFAALLSGTGFLAWAIFTANALHAAQLFQIGILVFSCVSGAFISNKVSKKIAVIILCVFHFLTGFLSFLAFMGV